MRIGTPKEGYTIIPSWIIPSALTGAIAVLNAYENNYDNKVEFLGEMSQISHKKVPCDKEGHYRNFLLSEIDRKKIKYYGNCVECEKCAKCKRIDPSNAQSDTLRLIRDKQLGNYGYCIGCARFTINQVKAGDFSNDMENKDKVDLALFLLRNINATPRTKRKVREFINEWEAKYGTANNASAE
jgi:hypothetical protein